MKNLNDVQIEPTQDSPVQNTNEPEVVKDSSNQPPANENTPPIQPKSTPEISENYQTNKYDTVEPNIQAAISYLIPGVMGVVILFIERKDKFVKFHATQSVLLLGLFIVFNTLAYELSRIIGIWVFQTPIRLCFFAVWIICMWKAFSKQEWEIPYFGKYVSNYVNKK